MDDFKFLSNINDVWIEEPSLNFLLKSGTTFLFKMVPQREMSNISVDVESDINVGIAVLNDVDEPPIFSSSAIITHLFIDETKFIVLKPEPDRTGDYKITFEFDYLVK